MFTVANLNMSTVAAYKFENMIAIAAYGIVNNMLTLSFIDLYMQ